MGRRMVRRLALSFILALVPVLPARAQQARTFTHADTLRGTDGPGRSWWDVTFYDLNVTVSPADSSIAGWNEIVYRVLRPGTELQIDLQEPMRVDSMKQRGVKLDYRRDGDAFFVRLPERQDAGGTHTVTVFYRGKPRAAIRPPWDGGYIWRRDSLGNRWISTANQGLGASVWWPNKDWGGDEPDSQRVAITVPTPMVDVSNGRLRDVSINDDGTSTFSWFVASPINNYSISVNAGAYAHWRELYEGEAGTLTMDFWPLAANEADARRQWTQARTMMKCFEHWFGPYPWYEDGYKLVEAPHLGMEHQSAVAYGNGYANGYRGTDLSGTGQGLTWDFIIVHESAHEWWGNNITAADGADTWIHESFANYAENLYVECQTGSKEDGAEYVIGTRARVVNDSPIIGAYGVNDEGSGDKYYKGGNMLHTIRQLVDDDAKWRSILRGLNETFRHQTVSSVQVEDYIATESGVELSKVFDEYLRTTMIPVLEWRIAGRKLSYRWTDVVDGFAMPVRVTLRPGTYSWIHPTRKWQDADVQVDAADFSVDENFYVVARQSAG